METVRLHIAHMSFFLKGILGSSEQFETHEELSRGAM